MVNDAFDTLSNVPRLHHVTRGRRPWTLQVFYGGSLFISNLMVHHTSNYTCEDIANDQVVQTHILRVQGTTHSIFTKRPNLLFLILPVVVDFLIL